MQKGIYEQIINSLIEEQVANINYNALREKLDSSDSHSYLAQYIYKTVESALTKLKPDKGADKVSIQIDLCNKIIDTLKNELPAGSNDDLISGAAERLMAITDNGKPLTRPDTPLALGALLTGTRQDPPLLLQLQKEMETADSIDILCSFIKWSGVRMLKDQFEAFTKRQGAKLRIITTSYMGATDIKAIEFLCALANTEVKVSYDTHRTRLHAKSYIFRRGTEFGSAYIGSSNLSNPALTEGLEWNVKISQYEQPYQWEKVSATFETYWNDIEFESCAADDVKKMRDALAGERKSGGADDAKDEIYFDLRPYAFQQEILDRIQAERELTGRTNHLIVAATGTGKTIVAAFDFKRWRKDFMAKNQSREPRFLFVAHREEILRQSLITFRHVLRNYNFGDMMVNGIVPSQIEQLFISIQSYNSKQFSDMLDAEHYDYVVIDEFHHSAAATYEYLLDHIKPMALLGLTATPERADNKDINVIQKHFGGHISAEIRLPDAINRKLLSPFQYFCVSDAVDYSTLKWQRGGYAASELDNLISANDIRANLVISQVREKLLDCSKARGIGFCVSQKHAGFMAAKFNAAGIKSSFLTSDSPDDHRRAIKQKLSSHEINFIFTVDLFNEGVDIPELDTVLFLRPTESLTVYLQQLGRGLRLHEEKECLTVLDFVGQAHKNFRFDLRFKALLTMRNRPLDEEIEAGLPYLPAGCTFHLEKKAKEYILENIRQSIRICRHAELIKKIGSFYEDTGKELSLENFKDYYQLEFYDIYKRATWSRLCHEASLVKGELANPDEKRLQKGYGRICHINDSSQIDFMIDALSRGVSASLYSDDISRRRLLMAYFSLWGKPQLSSAIDIQAGFDRLLTNKTHVNELIDLLKYNRDRIDHLPENVALPYPCPLQLHACYTRDEILAALGVWTAQEQTEVREGVKYDDNIKTDIFFITLNKNEKSYSPTTMYKDYAISDNLFHWQSQSTTAADSPTGRRYINHRARGVTVLLFVRENEKAHGGQYSSPFYYLGPADYMSHTGSKPLNVIWKLRAPMPAKLLRQTARLAV